MTGRPYTEHSTPKGLIQCGCGAICAGNTCLRCGMFATACECRELSNKAKHDAEAVHGISRRCHICGRLLSEESDPLSEDCGGDCAYCMMTVEDMSTIALLARGIAERAERLAKQENT